MKCILNVLQNKDSVITDFRSICPTTVRNTADVPHLSAWTTAYSPKLVVPSQKTLHRSFQGRSELGHRFLLFPGSPK